MNSPFMRISNNNSTTTTLERALSPADAAALLVSNVIGVGIFTVPGIVAGMVRSPWVMMSLWLAGGLLAYAGATAYAELAAMRPRAGGEYVYLREAFGPVAGFLTGWVSFVAGFSGAIAAGAVALAEYLGHFIPAAADTHPLFVLSLRVISFSPSRRDIVALATILVFSAIHVRGLRPGRLFQNTLTSLLVFGLGAFLVAGFCFGHGSLSHFSSPVTAFRLPQWLLAMVPIMFAYSGWNAASYMAEELRDPERNIPRALLLGTTIVVALYLLLNVLYLYALPPAQLAGVIRVGDVAAQALFGSRFAGVISALILLALAGGLSAWIVTGPRIYYAMAQDKVFFKMASRVHPRYHTPSASIWAQALWSSVLVLSGTFEQLLIYTGFAIILFSGTAVFALFVLRHKKAAVPRPFKVWGYPVVPALFVIAAFAMVVDAFVASPKTTGAGILIMLAGLPLYFWEKKKNGASQDDRPRCPTEY
jgi:APA family basic amino acid/polyamine antiporter